jgi:rhodanese-related sulfurtransferase
MSTSTDISTDSVMEEVLTVFPGARRALFRKYHIGGCSSCGFKMDETLGGVCERNNDLEVAEVLTEIQSSHEADQKILVEPKALRDELVATPDLKLLDVRSQEEFDAARIEGATHMTRDLMQEIMGKWDPEMPFVIIDHQGQQGLDAAAYYLGHGLKNVRCLRGGIDAWSLEVDESVARYEFS